MNKQETVKFAREYSEKDEAMQAMTAVALTQVKPELRATFKEMLEAAFTLAFLKGHTEAKAEVGLMDEAEARSVLGEALKGDVLDGTINGVSWAIHTENEVNLDGYFDEYELEALLVYLRSKNEDNHGD